MLPRFPRPEPVHRSLRIPPVPRMTGAASGAATIKSSISLRDLSPSSLRMARVVSPGCGVGVLASPVAVGNRLAAMNSSRVDHLANSCAASPTLRAASPPPGGVRRARPKRAHRQRDHRLAAAQPWPRQCIVACPISVELHAPVEQRDLAPHSVAAPRRAPPRPRHGTRPGRTSATAAARVARAAPAQPSPDSAAPPRPAARSSASALRRPATGLRSSRETTEPGLPLPGT